MEEKWILSGYEFESKAEYEKAKKEAVIETASFTYF